MNMTIRLAQPADAPALPAIERSAAGLFRLDPQLAWLADAEVAGVELHLQAIEQARVWVARSPEGQLAGFLRAVPVDNQLHVEELSVSQHFQGQGIGRKLLSAVIEHAWAQQLCAVTLTTFVDVPWNAPFYQKIGFQRLNSEETSGYLVDALNDEIAHGLPGHRRCAMRLTLP
ncbi:Acetyltransferase (GNAT) family protein [compost metagenome]|jgi:GNAT superfamily N-acetyltransferase|uniref:GNAT family N-acetyltransferase n=1 Tax=Pseudomonas germanica TaxID=2815720 RepID=A0ABX8YHQ4_9PSED|nr:MULTISPECIES: GNAT family N-acetyltransferase [Pseudomonas]QYY79193.1 GNAT family N-acetyltransferase [Pseudomonas germanica]WPN77459.1 GNAT family N-acetyltransferase [Pseudomonas germanica]